jgi:tRNA nucleotidyltransferase (CCA-adding enzyme)
MQVKNFVMLINYKLELDSYKLKKIIFKLGFINFFKLVIIKKNIFFEFEHEYNKINLLANQINLNQECVFIKDLKINGFDLKKLGFKDKNIGLALDYLLDLAHKDNLNNNKEFLLASAQKFLLL